MKTNKSFLYFLLFTISIVFVLNSITETSAQTTNTDRILSYVVDTKTQDLKFYWKDDSLEAFKSILNLKIWLDAKNKKLIFAMNGGMYKPDNSPLGLFILDNKTYTKLNTASADGNFYLKPNGVFYITNDKQGFICNTTEFIDDSKIKFATQSGPMLVINGNIHPVFKKGSTNLNLRNGVGILPDGKVIFAISKEPINFYDFAEYFRNLGCSNALYLDGFVSRAYVPEKNWMQTDGNFGVIIGVTAK